jgi:hypothetical protein
VKARIQHWAQNQKLHPATVLLQLFLLALKRQLLAMLRMSTKDGA